MVLPLWRLLFRRRSVKAPLGALLLLWLQRLLALCCQRLRGCRRLCVRCALRMHRVCPMSPTTLLSCWRSSGQCDVLNVNARSRSAVMRSKPQLSHSRFPLLVSLLLTLLVQAQPAHAQSSGKLLQQRPLRCLTALQALTHPLGLEASLCSRFFPMKPIHRAR